MGLDMFFTRKTYVKNWDHMQENEKHSIVISKNDKPVKHIEPSKIRSIEEELMYWRKANHIHNWFVENCQNGEDDCREAYVEYEQLLELKDICKKVLDNHDLAEDLLPTQSGFFFGGTAYDSYYFDDVQRTFDFLEKLTQEHESATTNHYFPDYYYHSSW